LPRQKTAALQRSSSRALRTTHTPMVRVRHREG
jgi:hypothetical protein